MKKNILLLFCLIIVSQAYGQSIGTPTDREALFDLLVEQTVNWEAWSSFKERKNPTDYATDAESLRDDFVDAASEFELVIALQKLSNLRHDRHLSLNEDFPRVSSKRTSVPVVFWPDFSSEEVKVFAADTATNFNTYYDGEFNLGDEVVQVNGTDTKAYYESLRPFLKYSTTSGAWWEFSKSLAIKNALFAPSLYRPDNTVRYTLKRSNGTTYTVEMSYKEESYSFTGTGDRSLEGYTLLMQTVDVDMYVKYFDDNAIVLLRWLDFEEVASTSSKITQIAKENNLRQANVILDLSQSSGGSKAPDLVKILAQEPFQTTWGNVRIGDYLDDFKLGFSGKVREWLDTDVEIARSNKEEYAAKVPFKLQYFPKTSDGIMAPSSQHFQGKVVLITGSDTGSQVDQCAAMMIDNNIPQASIGMPCGGFSNTWEHESRINFPEGSDNFFDYAWNIGHTIRPNGEILEGNPALPQYLHLLTANNFKTYYDDMIQAAEDTLLAYPVVPICSMQAPVIKIEEGRLVTGFNTKYKYQWYKDDTLLEEETNRILSQNPSKGTYKVKVSQGLCSIFSNAFEYTITSVRRGDSRYRLFPNPVQTNQFVVETQRRPMVQPSFKLFDLSGKAIPVNSYHSTFDHQYVLGVSGSPKGCFVLKIYDQGTEQQSLRLIIK